VRSGNTADLYDIAAVHEAQVALVPESGPELYPPVYPPQVSLLFAPFSTLSFAHATLLGNLISIGVFAVIVRSVWTPLAAQLPDSVFLLAAAATFPPFWSVLLFGQVTILILAAFWAGWLALERDRPFLAGMALGLLLLKPQFAIPIAVVVLVQRDWKMLAGAAASTAIQVACVVALLDWSVFQDYAAFLSIAVQHADLLQAKAFQSHSLRALTRLAPASIAFAFWGLIASLVLAFTIRIWRSGAPLRVRFGAVILASVLVNPHLLIYDATVVALPLIWFGAYIQERRAPREAALYWTSVYWLFVTLLAPSARLIGLQVSVLLMVWLLVLIGRVTRGRHDACAFSLAAHTRTAGLPP